MIQKQGKLFKRGRKEGKKKREKGRKRGEKERKKEKRKKKDTRKKNRGMVGKKGKRKGKRDDFAVTILGRFLKSGKGRLSKSMEQYTPLFKIRSSFYFFSLTHHPHFACILNNYF